MNYSVYHLFFPNGKIYIGLTGNIKKRMRQHNNNKSLVGNAFRKHGHPIVTILFNGEVEECKIKEIKYIQKFSTRAPHGYNLTDGGDGIVNLDEGAKKKISEALVGRKMSQETKDKISASKIGKGTWNKGIKPSQKTKEKMSKARMGKTPWNKGRAWTLEVRKIMSDAHIGNKHSEETKRKMRGPRGAYGPRKEVNDGCC